MHTTEHTQRQETVFVFLLTVMIVVELVTLLVIGVTRLFSLPIVCGIGCVMALVSVGLFRMCHIKKLRYVPLKRAAAGLVWLCVIAGCLLSCGVCLLMGGSLRNMFAAEASGIKESAKNVILPAVRPFAVYLSGSDSRTDTLAEGAQDFNSDVNIIAVVNPSTNQVLLINTPRDYYIPNPAVDGAMDLLTHCGYYGIDNSRQALSDLYGLHIQYTAQINFRGFEALVDALGGVTIVSEMDFYTSEDGYHILQGENHLDGAHALAFARERAAFAGGDNTRGENQMKVITALVEQTSAGDLFANYREILRSLEGTFETSMPLSSVITLAVTQLKDLSDWEVLSYAVKGRSGQGYNYTAGGTAFAMHPDYDSVARATELIGRVMEGEVLSAEDLA